MQPRLKSSKKWTAFPKEYSQQIETVFRENFAEKLGEGKLVIEGRIYPEEVMLRVGINKPKQLSQPNFEVSMNYDPKKKDAVERIHNCIDAAASMMLEYLETEGAAEFPLVWEQHPFQGQTIFLQFTTENSDLEAQANALLGEEADSLINEEEGADDEVVDGLSDNDLVPEEDEETDEENPDQDPSPRMFGGKASKKKKSKLH